MKIVDTGVRWGMGTHDIFVPWKYELYSPMSLKDMERYLEQTKPDLALFGGGTDLNPKIYKHNNVASAHEGPNICRRDLFEIMVWQMLKRLGVPTLGICRGAQLSCALSGGALYQDVQGHLGSHNIQFEDGTVMPMTSTHHQMMLPFEINHELIAWATQPLSDKYLMDKTSPEYKKHPTPNKESEIVYFPDTKALAIQGHPEYWKWDHPSVVKTRQLVNKYLLNGAMPDV